MKWTFALALSLAIVAGCEKSNVTPQEAQDQKTTAQATGTNTEKNTLLGRWQLVEYWQDNGDGTGKWVAATESEELLFTASGEFKATGNSPLAMRGYDRYRIIDGNYVELYSSSNAANKETYLYNRESAANLVFNPQCRENCSRRYKLVG
ncbi:MAG TPA: hypothetical protein VD996_11635 [Chitinophagaceae bacterium]|nr:hypothetical protein [Chitinophagaceae bacterium]